MFALIYASKDDLEFNHQQLLDLCDESAARNSELDVTGYLYHRKWRFFQYLEGNKAAVTELMNRIENDNRHTIISVVYDDNIIKRRFPSWDMQYIHLDTIQLEDVIDSHLTLLSRIGDDVLIRERIWSAVDKLARLHGTFRKQGRVPGDSG